MAVEHRHHLSLNGRIIMGNSLTAVAFYQSPLFTSLLVSILGPVTLFLLYYVIYRFLKKPKIIISDYKDELDPANPGQEKFFARIPIKFCVIDLWSDDVLFGEKVIVEMRKAGGKSISINNMKRGSNGGYNFVLRMGTYVCPIEEWEVKIRRNEVVVVEGILDVSLLMKDEGPHEIKTQIYFKNIFGRKIRINYKHKIK